MQKVCTSCHQLKDFANYHKAKLGKFGLKAICKVCHSDQSKKLEKTEKVRAKRKLKRSTKEYKEWSQAYRRDNADKLREYAKSYELTSEQLKAKQEYSRDFKKKNRGLINSWTAERRSRKKRAMPSWVDRQDLKKIYENCPKGYHVDHVIPLKNDIVCGLHVPWNLQYLPAIENIKKGNKLKGVQI